MTLTQSLLGVREGQISQTAAARPAKVCTIMRCNQPLVQSGVQVRVDTGVGMDRGRMAGHESTARKGCAASSCMPWHAVWLESRSMQAPTTVANVMTLQYIAKMYLHNSDTHVNKTVSRPAAVNGRNIARRFMGVQLELRCCCCPQT